MTFKWLNLGTICLTTLLWVGILCVKIEKMDDKLDKIQEQLEAKKYA